MSTKIRVLFVDDEPNVLAAIKRMLRIKRNEWDMEFAESGMDALKLVEAHPYDVVVSDIRMPGMDGAELLSRIKDVSPKTIRIALSGQVDMNEVLRSIRTVHQYISKPCDVDKLVSKIEGALASREVLTDEKMIDLVTEIDALPVIPKVFQDIEAELEKERPSIEKVAVLITQDVGLVTRILKLVNSPFFGLPSNITSVHKAITMLGLDTIKALILSTHLFTMYDNSSLPDFSLPLLWDHCFRVSNIARLIAECEGLGIKIVTRCRMAGLLHDVGKLILANYYPKKYQQVLDIMEQGGGPISKAEHAVFGTTHAEVGAFLMGLWGVNSEVVHGIGYHHGYEKTDMTVAMLLSVADVIDHHCIVFNDNYSKITLNRGMVQCMHHEGYVEKWLVYLKEHWVGVEGQYVVDEEVLSGLLG